MQNHHNSALARASLSTLQPATAILIAQSKTRARLPADPAFSVRYGA